MNIRYRTALIVISVVLLTALAGGHPAEGQTPMAEFENEVCGPTTNTWKKGDVIDGVKIKPSQRCSPDNPNVIASVVKGTNNIQDDVLRQTGLARDAVVKRNDRDDDGDPDEIQIRLEITGINEFQENDTRHEIAPGISPAFWTFAPKTRGMLDAGSKADQLIRPPSPSIRVEEGDQVTIEIENTHYMPHTLNLHGVDHKSAVNGSGNNGIPQISEKPIQPGESRTYEIQPKTSGSMFYQCNVVPNIHGSMGLNGMFVVEEERPNNTVQTLNIGAGKVRNPSEAVEEQFKAEYDLVYQSIDKELHEIPKQYNDTRRLSKEIHREYDVTDAQADYFLLNGRSFPYTIRESIIPVERNERYRLRTVNVGKGAIALHPHGHKVTVIEEDGVPIDPRQRDVIDIAPAQRADIVLNTTVNGLNSYGEGNWILHDRRKKGMTNDGIAPGGMINMIVYEDYVDEKGIPETATDISRFFSEEFQQGEIPYFPSLDQETFGNITPLPDVTNNRTAVGRMPATRMRMVEDGNVVNENLDTLPQGCDGLRGKERVVVKAGEEFAEPGQAYGYSQDEFRFEPCTRVTVVLENQDEIRHQWMLHGLPTDIYPMGMFNVEVQGQGRVSGTFVTPAEPGRLNLHCSLPQHKQKGMRAHVVIAEDRPGLLDRISSFLGTLI